MENFKAIELHKTRDFGNKMNVTFEFVKQNFKALTKSILFIAGPPILVASMLIGSFIGDFFNLATLGTSGDPELLQQYFMSVNFWLQLVLIFVFFLVSGVTTIATINNYILLYSEKRSNKIEVNEVWERVRATFWMYLGTMFLFSLLAIVVYALMFLPVILLAAISPWLIFFGVIFLIVGFFYILVGSSLVFIVRAYEKISFFGAIMRSFRLVQGKWWSTFGLITVLYLIVGTVAYLFLIPWYAITLTSTLHNLSASTVQEPSSGYQLMTMFFFTLYYLVQMILYSLPNVGIAFQYFNLVERKEARGLMDQIDSIGHTPATSNSADEHY